MRLSTEQYLLTISHRSENGYLCRSTIRKMSKQLLKMSKPFYEMSYNPQATRPCGPGLYLVIPYAPEIHLMISGASEIMLHRPAPELDADLFCLHEPDGIITHMSSPTATWFQGLNEYSFRPFVTLS